MPDWSDPNSDPIADVRETLEAMEETYVQSLKFETDPILRWLLAQQRAGVHWGSPESFIARRLEELTAQS